MYSQFSITVNSTHLVCCSCVFVVACVLCYVRVSFNVFGLVCCICVFSHSLFPGGYIYIYIDHTFQKCVLDKK